MCGQSDVSTESPEKKTKVYGVYRYKGTNRDSPFDMDDFTEGKVYVRVTKWDRYDAEYPKRRHDALFIGDDGKTHWGERQSFEKLAYPEL